MSDIVIGDWTKLGSTVRAQRRRLELSQAEAAERAHVSRSWLAKVEGGHRGVELEQLIRLLTALEITIVLRTSSAADRTSVDRQLADRRQRSAANRRRAWSGDEGPLADD